MKYCLAAAMLSSLLGVAGCANTLSSSPGSSAATLYDDLGQGPGIAALVDQFLWRLADDERVNQRFAETNITRFREKLNEQFCVLSGGPCIYTGDSMREVHAGHDIREAQFNAVVEDLIEAMESLDIATGTQNRLLAVLAPLHGDIVAR